MHPMSVDEWKRFGERWEGNDACSAAGQVKNELFAKLERAAAGVDFEFVGAPIPSRLAKGTRELGGGGAEELSEGL